MLVTNIVTILVFSYLCGMQKHEAGPGRRVVLVHWVNKTDNAYEVFSNLKNFCARYPAYSYHTLNNYLSKLKVPFENEEVHVERKKITGAFSQEFRLVPVVRKGKLIDIDEEKEDMHYWLSRPVSERIAAVTFLVNQSLEKGTRMDKTVVKKRMLNLR